MSKAKGDVLEDVVALLHQTGAGNPEVRVQLPTTSNRNRTREIDVLLRHRVAGDPVLVVFECKNEGKPVGVEYIDAFFGKLYDVGIPPSQGVFVSSNRYTRGARERAAICGIRLLVLDGLNVERMAAAVNDALLSIVHFVLAVSGVSAFPFLPPDAPGDPLPDGWERNLPRLYDYIWRRWIKGTLPQTLGEHMVPVRTGQGGAVMDCIVRAHVGTVTGTGTRLILKDASSGILERGRIDTTFQLPTSLPLRTFTTEDELQTVLRSDMTPAVIHRVRVPRIVINAIFWPPSNEAVTKLRELIASGEEATFARVEGADLARAWMNFESAPDLPLRKDFG